MRFQFWIDYSNTCKFIAENNIPIYKVSSHSCYITIYVIYYLETRHVVKKVKVIGLKIQLNIIYCLHESQMCLQKTTTLYNTRLVKVPISVTYNNNDNDTVRNLCLRTRRLNSLITHFQLSRVNIRGKISLLIADIF